MLKRRCPDLLRGWPVLLAIAVTATVAAPAGAATLTAPVVHEGTVQILPCTGTPGNRTTVQLEGCGEHQVLRSDATIDALNAKIFAKLQTARAQRDFITGHNDWFAYRNAYCTSESDIDQGGTLAVVVYVDCLATVNTAHVHELNAFLADFNS